MEEGDGAPGSPQTAAPNMQPFSTRDLQFVIRFCQEFAGDQFRHLVHALCPAIYGHELIKARACLTTTGIASCSCAAAF